MGVFLVFLTVFRFLIVGDGRRVLPVSNVGLASPSVTWHGPSLRRTAQAFLERCEECGGMNRVLRTLMG